MLPIFNDVYLSDKMVVKQIFSFPNNQVFF